MNSGPSNSREEPSDPKTDFDHIVSIYRDQPSTVLCMLFNRFKTSQFNQFYDSRRKLESQPVPQGPDRETLKPSPKK